MIRSKIVEISEGPFKIKRRVIDGWNGHNRLFVRKTNIGTYIVHKDKQLRLDNMVEIAGEYHFNTLKQLHEALQIGDTGWCTNCSLVELEGGVDRQGCYNKCIQCGERINN